MDEKAIKKYFGSGLSKKVLDFKGIEVKMDPEHRSTQMIFMNLPAAEQRGIKPSFQKAQRAYPWFDMLTTLPSAVSSGRMEKRRKGI